MAVTEPLRVGLIGCGRIADLQVLGYKDLPTARLVAVCDKDRSRAKARAEAWGVERVYTDYHKLLADPAIDMVEVVVPHYLHAEMAIAAAQAGKHISVQKPMALNIAEAEAMIAAAKAARVKLRVYENFVFYPPYRRAMELIQAGQIGEPQMIHLHLGAGSQEASWEVPLSAWLWRFRKSKSGGGLLVFDDGYHKFSIARWFMGPVTRVQAWIDSTMIAPLHHVDGPAVIMWQHSAPRRYGMMDVTYSPKLRIESDYYSADERVEIVGSEGIIWINRCTTRTVDRPAIELFRQGKTTGYDDMPTGWESSFIACTRHFVEAILNNTEPMLNGEQGKEVLQFALAALRSAELDGQAVRPAEVK
jgi:predicted dehydrogenase